MYTYNFIITWPTLAFPVNFILWVCFSETQKMHLQCNFRSSRSKKTEGSVDDLSHDACCDLHIYAGWRLLLCTWKCSISRQFFKISTDIGPGYLLHLRWKIRICAVPVYRRLKFEWVWRRDRWEIRVSFQPETVGGGLQHVEQNMYEYICLVDTVECMQRNCAHVRECLHDFYLICILPLP